MQLVAGGFLLLDPPDRVWYRMSAVPLLGLGICRGSIRTVLLLLGVPEVGVEALNPPGVSMLPLGVLDCGWLGEGN
jgi:hypothetical protein